MYIMLLRPNVAGMRRQSIQFKLLLLHALYNLPIYIEQTQGVYFHLVK
jgi:hypothetical protein